MVVIRKDEVTATNAASGASATVRAPFSCDHLLADDIDLLEYASHQAIKQVVAGFLSSYPKLEVSTGGRPLHGIERKAINDAMLNAGASKVSFSAESPSLNERAAERTAFIASVKRQR